MKASTAYLGLGAILPHVAFAGQPKQWEQQRQLFEKRAASNYTIGGGNTINVAGSGSYNNQVNSENTDNNNTNINLDLNATIINNFNTGVINFYSTSPDCYYAKMCPTCNIVKVSSGNNTYVDRPCPVCPVETMHSPGYSSLKTVPHGSNGTSGVYTYQPPVCLSCHAVPAPPPPPPPPSMTTVAVLCPTCPVTSQVITCPATAASSIASIATVSGASVAKFVASQATGITVTAPTTVTSPASFTIVNLPCSSCPAGTQAVTVAQVTPGPASTPGSSPPGSPGSPASPGNVSSPAGTGLATAHFTGSADSIVASVFSIILGLVASMIMIL